MKRPPSKSRAWPAVLLVVLAVSVVFGRIASHEWLHWDDDVNLWQNPDFNPVTPEGAAHYWAHAHADLYAPVTYTAWGVIGVFAQRGGAGHYSLSPAPFHVASVIAHAVVAVSVLLLLRRLGFGVPAALAGALCYALHPLQVEAVAWASGLKDVLCGMFCVQALWFYAGTSASRPRRASLTPSYLAATLLFVLAMLSKPQAVCLPFVLVVVGRLLLRRPWRPILIDAGLWVALAAPIVFVGHAVQPGGIARVDNRVAVRPLVALDDLSFYGQKLLAPVDLCVEYSRTTARLMASPRRAWTWLPPLALGALAFAVRRRWPPVAAGLAIVPAALLPVLGFVPFEFQDTSNVADHYVYLAMLGPAVIVAHAASPIARRAWARAAGVAVLAALGVASWVQCGDWRSDETLFAHAIAVNPSAVGATTHVATRRVVEGRWPEAETWYRRALELDPRNPVVSYDLGNLLYREGRLDEAVALYRRSLDVLPDNADAHTNLGIALTKQGRWAESVDEYRRSLSLQPANAKVWTALGQALANVNQFREAEAALTRALELNPQMAPARQMLDSLRAQLETLPRR